MVAYNKFIHWLKQSFPGEDVSPEGRVILLRDIQVLKVLFGIL